MFDKIFIKNVNKNKFKFNNEDSKSALDLLKVGFRKARIEPFHPKDKLLFK